MPNDGAVERTVARVNVCKKNGFELAAFEVPDIEAVLERIAELEAESTAIEKECVAWREQHEADKRRIAELEAALKPFHDAVFNESGNPDAADSFPDHISDEEWLAAYNALAGGTPTLDRMIADAKRDGAAEVMQEVHPILLYVAQASNRPRPTAEYFANQNAARNLLDKAEVIRGGAAKPTQP